MILYQEQVMKVAIDVAGFSAAESDGFRRAMGTWRSRREMEKLHARFVEGCVRVSGLTMEQAEELFGRSPAFASFGFNKSHAAAFARTAYESAFLKLFYPAQFVTGLINAQPMGFYPVEVLINDAKHHGVAVLPVDINRSRFRTTTEWVGHARYAAARGCRHRPATGRGALDERGGPRSARPATGTPRPPRAATGSAWASTWSRASARRRARHSMRSSRAAVPIVVSRTSWPAPSCRKR